MSEREEAGVRKEPPSDRDAGGRAMPPPDERTLRLELVVSNVLRYGVVLSFVVTVLGFALLLAATYSGPSQPGLGAVFPPPRGHAEVLRSPAEVAAGLRRGDPNAVVVLGLLILLVTPILRVAVSTVAFAFQRDWRYVAITTYVLIVLAVSFAVGAVG